MNAQALTTPVTRISVPMLLLAAAGTAAGVSAVVVALDERTTVIQRIVPASAPTTQTYDPMQAYVDSLIERRRQYLESVQAR